MVVVYPWACLWVMPAFCPDLWAWKLLKKLEPGGLTWEVLGELVGITVCCDPSKSDLHIFTTQDLFGYN